MKIDPIAGEYARFFVTSETSPNSVEPYLVDLEEMDCNGQCDCPDFKCHHAPKVGKDGDWHTCKHIDACLIVVGRRTVQSIAREHYDTETANKIKNEQEGS